ncbi:MAG: TonB-dependent receptor, partial [Gammaproteobacteria bacterium]|nr:TonB-dependent receptor [Gammaproteobacteria bacterium]
KRPTTERQARVDLTGGSWDMRRVDTDVSGALSEDGGVRGRLVVAHENKNSYLDNYAREKNIVHAVVDAELTATTQLTVGHTYQTSDANAPLWGALPLAYTDGSLTHYHRNTSTATPWSFWDVQEDRTFAELSQTLGAGWSVKAVVTHLEKKGHGKLFYVYGTPDAVTEQGLAAFPSRYDDRTRQLIADLYAQGPFELAGRTHELVLGTGWSRSELDDVSHYGQGIGTPLPSLLEWTGAYPEPGFDAFVNGSDFTDRQTAYYAAARWSLLDPLTLLTGTRVVNAQSRGINYGEDRAANASGEVVPYAGLVYEITPSYSVYTSYTKIFDTQTETDANGDRLAPVTGETYEIGAKAGVLDERVNLGITLFRTRQDNVAEQTGMVGTQAIYRAAKGVVSEGFELDVNGELVSGLHLGAGYTYVDIQGPDGENPRAYAPQHLFRVATSYRVPVHPALKVGANVQWQDTIDRTVALTPSGTAVVKQDSYALLNLMASYDIATHWQAAINLNNVTNEKYLTSLQWDQSYYGAPRNASMTLSWKY